MTSFDRYVKKLFVDQKFCDVGISLRNGDVILCHSLVLSFQSPRLNHLLESTLVIDKNSKTYVIELTSFDPDVVRYVISDFYEEHTHALLCQPKFLDFSKDKLFELCKLATYLELQEVIESCNARFLDTLTVGNCMQILEIASLDIRENVESFITAHFNLIPKDDPFFKALNENITNKVLNVRMDFPMSQKMQLVIDFVEADPEGRFNTLPWLLTNIDLGHIDIPVLKTALQFDVVLERRDLVAKIIDLVCPQHSITKSATKRKSGPDDESLPLSTAFPPPAEPSVDGEQAPPFLFKPSPPQLMHKQFHRKQIHPPPARRCGSSFTELRSVSKTFGATKPKSAFDFTPAFSAVPTTGFNFGTTQTTAIPSFTFVGDSNTGAAVLGSSNAGGGKKPVLSLPPRGLKCFVRPGEETNLGFSSPVPSKTTDASGTTSFSCNVSPGGRMPQPFRLAPASFRAVHGTSALSFDVGASPREMLRSPLNGNSGTAHTTASGMTPLDLFRRYYDADGH